MAQTMVETDIRVGSDVADELEWTPGLEDAGIDVVVVRGEVVLSGSVGTYPQKLAAIEAARRVHGVGEVSDQMVVAGSGTAVADDELAERAKEALWDTVDFPDFVEVSAARQVLSLSGQVRWNYQREAAVRAVSGLPGVNAVLNGIVLLPGVVATGMRTGITHAFRRNAELRDANITVTTEASGLIILDGTVSSWTRLAEAERTAWCAPGATFVANNLRISG